MFRWIKSRKVTLVIFPKKNKILMKHWLMVENKELRCL